MKSVQVDHDDSVETVVATPKATAKEVDVPPTTQITMTKQEYDALMFANSHGIQDANLGQELITFEAKVGRAKQMGEDSVEASEDLINHYNPRGLGTAKYFTYKGIKVYPNGQTDAIESEESVLSINRNTKF